MRRSKIRNMEKFIWSVLLCLVLAAGLFGCGKTPEPSVDPGQEEEPENDQPLDGDVIDQTDYDAPKVIGSKEITDLYTNLYLGNRWAEDEQGTFEFAIKEDDEGILTAYEKIYGISAPADQELLTALQQVIDDNGLASVNGVNKVTSGLPPEFAPCRFRAGYGSGETLMFTVDNDPYSQWGEDIYDVFAAWFSAKGINTLYPPEETSPLTRFMFIFNDRGLTMEYGTWNVREDQAVDGETFLLERSVYNTESFEDISNDYIPIPDGYFETLGGIIKKYDLLRKYLFSYYDHDADDFGNHDRGYYGMGDKTTADKEEDSKDLSLEFFVEYESGERMRIETKKKSEIDALRPALDEILAYHEPLFDS